jgi:murein DD-endopeptidase MepM/ murein hydrolase activator NlpD
MPLLSKLSHAYAWPNWAALTIIAIGIAGCSADSTRLGANSFFPYDAQKVAGASDLTASAAGTAPTPEVQSPSTQPAAVSADAVQQGDVGARNGLSSHRKHYGRPLVEPARVRQIPPTTKVTLGDHPVIAVRRAPAPRPADQPDMLVPGTGVETKGPDQPTRPQLGLRWPVRAKIIAFFGSMHDGQQNDGINFSVPEGTPVKAAEDGVVIDAGNGAARHGKVVLVRHTNGYVTRYAHLSELLVERGGSVKRGQSIARAGQTGSVSSPQLHFEVRKGTTPVDPMPLLDSRG